ncbi:MAG: DHH family phosphoesterase, partial [Thermoguttaceae bacterium]|nr:DHH family phosphoesterase [Thermoguttaceae bacterium]
MIDWKPFVELVSASQNIVVAAHVRPDGDCLGSALALARALRKLGKTVLVVNAQTPPPNLAFLDPDGDVVEYATLSEERRAFVLNADLRMSVDTSAWAQLGPAGEIFKLPGARKAVIDHHAIADDVGAERFVDPRADSAGSLVFDAIQALGVELTPDVAFPLFVAISTDTGWFRFGSTSAETYRRAAALVEAGVRPDAIYKII